MIEADPAELRVRYTNEIVRLEGLVDDLTRERARLKWFVVASFALAPLGLFYRPLAVAGIASLGVITYFVGLYLNRVHHEEYAFHLERAREILEGLDEGKTSAEGS